MYTVIVLLMGLFLIFTDFIQAATLYWNLHKVDPYRLTGIDIYSNVLFVMVTL